MEYNEVSSIQGKVKYICLCVINNFIVLIVYVYVVLLFIFNKC